MKFQINFLLATILLCGTAFAQEQHFDVEFGYEGGQIIFENDQPGIDNAGIFEADFEVMNPDGTQETEDPGFSSNFTKGPEMFEVPAGDTIFVNANQSATLGNFLNYYNPVTGSFESTTATITIEDNSPMGTSDLLISEASLSGDPSQFVTTSTGAFIDTHVDFILSAGAADGVYGVLLNIESDNASGQLTDTTSGNFWVLFNNGLSEEVFEESVGAFAVPEPSALVVMPLALATVFRRKRS